MRNIEDYKIYIRGKEESLGDASPFNIIEKTFALRNFTFNEVCELYHQHTSATKQQFTAEAIRRVFDWTDGQPWLVNAIAKQIVEEDLHLDYSRVINEHHVDAAVDTISKRRDTHILSLFNRLEEDRVRRVIEPMLAGTDTDVNLLDRDCNYCIDIGLVKRNSADYLCPANRMYADLIIRYLTYTQQTYLPKSLENKWMDDKCIHMTQLLKEFQHFWRENAHTCKDKFLYSHATAQLLLQAFLQRVVNGGAMISREYALNSLRLDLCVTYQQKHYPIEVKLASHDAISVGIPQLKGYMDICGTNEGWLIIFDQSSGKSWQDRLFWEDRALEDGGCIHVIGC
jgi:hypothetical protein